MDCAKWGPLPAVPLRLALIALLCLSAGCSLHGGSALRPAEGAPDKAVVDGVPFYPQERYQCGPASLAMVLAWSGVEIRPDDLTDSVYTPSAQGSLQSAMIGGARRQGRVAYELARKEDLMAELAAGNPVVVLLNLGLSIHPVWHYAVTVGYDTREGELLLHSGETRHKLYGFDHLDAMWARSDHWGLLVLPPDRLPATVEEHKWLQAVVGLEQTGQFDAARTAYREATQQWPDSYGAWMGLGNSLYALDRPQEAATAFEHAARLRPEDGVAFNNMASVLSELGRHEQAVAAAERAVSLGGPHQETFRSTLSEVRRNAGR